MTDLESPKKNNDCYFYYYSTCAKGDNCTFRHEPSALGCETMCSFWKEGKCLNVHCNFRHMELRKNRKVIPCYWESQPVGCLKAHCPFMHQNPRPSDDMSVEKSNMSPEKPGNDNDTSERKVTAADSLVVNFEEESDTDSISAYSPLKNTNRIVKVKSLEEIKLEKIQAESAAYYSCYEDDQDTEYTNVNSNDLRQRIVRRIVSKQQPQRIVTVTHKAYPQQKVKTNKRLSDDELATILGDESLRKRQKIIQQKDNGDFQITLNKSVPEKETSFLQNVSQSKLPPKSVTNIKIKTLTEIRAERNARGKDNVSPKNMQMEQEEAEVSSTSGDDIIQKILQEERNKNQNNMGPKKKIKLRRKLHMNEENVTSIDKYEKFTDNEENILTSSSSHNEYSEIQIKPKLKSLGSELDKMDEDVLLLDEDDEEYEDISMKGEDELLNEISSFIDN